jgi:hypothetical protein
VFSFKFFKSYQRLCVALWSPSFLITIFWSYWALKTYQLAITSSNFLVNFLQNPLHSSRALWTPWPKSIIPPPKESFSKFNWWFTIFLDIQNVDRMGPGWGSNIAEECDEDIGPWGINPFIALAIKTLKLTICLFLEFWPQFRIRKYQIIIT